MDTTDETRSLAESARSTDGAKGDDDRTVLRLKTPVMGFPPPPDGARPLYEHLSQWLVRSRALARACLSTFKPCERKAVSVHASTRQDLRHFTATQADAQMAYPTYYRTIGGGSATHQALQNGGSKN